MFPLLHAAPSLAQVAPPEARFVASSRGTVYYPVGCEAGESLSPANLLWFRSAAEAEEAGLRLTTNRDCVAPLPAVGSSDGSAPSAGVPELQSVCTITRIIDGDTVDCAELGENVRLLLIDAPERAQVPDGPAARDALQRLLPVGSVAKLELDVQERDRYRRILAYLYTSDGRMVNEVMVRDGYALLTVVPPNVRHVERIRAAGELARSERRGLWAGSAFACLPGDYRAGRCGR